MKYRPEIDGLRTVAVLPVLFFHAGFGLFAGGFVGVDVFFVISGYLITNILIEDYYEDRFSLLTFYERRARRILPALFVVMLVTIPFAWAWMLPHQLKDFSQSIVSVVLFASNFLFWKEEGYFAAAAELKPMLHTWSLAVEEQYYLIFPLLLLALLRRGLRRTVLALSGIALLSLAFSEWGSHNWPSTNFYLAPSRIWELMAGSLCAFALRFRRFKENEFLASLGLLLVLGSIFLLDNSVPFPGLYAVPPVLGTALVILYARARTIVRRLLSVKIFVGVGLISYSTYLWHQPLFALARLRLLHEPPSWLMALLIAMSLGLAYLSWRFIERPVRERQISLFDARWKIFAGSAVAGTAFMVFGVLGHITGGWGELRSGSVDLLALDQRVAGNLGLSTACDGSFSVSPLCRTSDTPEVLLWGDSFAMHLAQGLLASAEDLAIQQHTMSVCSPVIGLARVGNDRTTDWARSCMEFNDQVLAWLQQNDSVEYVILSSPMNIVDGTLLLHDGTVRSAGDNMDVIERETIRTVEMIRETGAKVVFVSPTPRPVQNIGLCTAKADMFGADEAACDFPVEDISNTRSFDLMDRLQPQVPVIRLDRAICNGEVCDVIQNGVAIYRDTGHLTAEGSAMIGGRISLMDQIRQIAQ